MADANVPTNTTVEQADAELLAAIAASYRGEDVDVERATLQMTKARAGTTDPRHLRMLRAAAHLCDYLGGDTHPDGLNWPKRSVRNLRNDLVRMIMAPGTTAATAPTEPTSVDPHIAWSDEADQVFTEGNSQEEDSANKPLFARGYALQELIATTPARTAAGIAEQIRMAIDQTDSGSTLSDYDLAGLNLAFETLHAKGAALV